MKNTGRISPEFILYGLLDADRESLCAFLALFESASLSKLLASWLTKQVGSLERLANKNGSFTAQLPDEIDETIRKRAAELLSNSGDDNELRVRLWIHLRSSFGLLPSITLSERGVQHCCADLGACIAAGFRSPADDRALISKVSDSSWWKSHADAVKAKIQGESEQFQFHEAVLHTVLSLVAGQLRDADNMSTEAREELFSLVKAFVRSSGDEQSINALQQSDLEAISDDVVKKVLAGAGGVGAIGVGVEMAGFSAYILAAKASAIIPFVGGKTLVSLLAVLASPLFIIPAIIAMVFWGKNRMADSVARSLASVVAIFLVMQHLASKEKTAIRFTNVFTCLSSPPSTGLLPLPAWHDYQALYRVMHEAPGDRGAPKPNPYVAMKLSEPAVVGGDDRLQWLFPPEGQSSDRQDFVAVSCISVGDLLYHRAMLDPLVLEAADFSHVEEIQGATRFAHWVGEKSRDYSAGDLNGELSDAVTQRLKGYVAEQYVAARLIEEGHIVGLPKDANQPGYDLIVDGQPFQVKCVSDLDALKAHFETYPDIPAYVNIELREAIEQLAPAWAVEVYFLDGFSNELVMDLTNQSIEAAAELVDIDVPLNALCVVAARNLFDWWRGGIDSREAVWRIVATGSTRSTLALIGGLGGQYGGLLVFGPAGAVIGPGLGSLLALTGTGSVTKSLEASLTNRSPDYLAWLKNLRLAASDLLDSTLKALANKERLLEEKLAAFGDSEIAKVMAVKLCDEMLFIRERQCELIDLKIKLSEMDEPGIRKVLVSVMNSQVLPWHIQQALEEFGKIWQERPDKLHILGENVAASYESGRKLLTRLKARFT